MPFTPIPRTPSPVQLRTHEPPPGRPGEGLPAQFDGAANRAEAPKPHRSNPFSSLASGVLKVLSGASNKVGVTVTGELRREPAKINGKDDERECVNVTLDVLTKVSDKLTPLLHQQGPLSGADLSTFSKAIRDIGVNMRMLAQQVEGPDGQLHQFLGVSDKVARQVQALAALPLSNGKTIESLFDSGDRRHSVLDHAFARQQLVRFVDEVKQVVLKFAEATGDPDRIAQAEGLFPDPLVAELAAQLEGVNEQLIATGNYRKLPGEPGVRHKDVRYNADNRIQLSNGVLYNAHRIATADGTPIGWAASYPQPPDMPNFLRMLCESGVSNVVVLASRDEILGKPMPYYFHAGNTYGNYRVDVRSGPNTDHGPMHAKAYTMTITDRRTGKVETKTVTHVKDWADKTTQPAEALLGLASHLGSNGATCENTLVHCSAGVGRTGTLLLAMALRENPHLSAGEIIVSMRADRSPLMVQTRKQLETAVSMQREMEARPTGDDEAIYDTANLEYVTQLQRQSYADVAAPADGEVLARVMAAHDRDSAQAEAAAEGQPLEYENAAVLLADRRARAQAQRH